MHRGMVNVMNYILNKDEKRTIEIFGFTSIGYACSMILLKDGNDLFCYKSCENEAETLKLMNDLSNFEILDLESIGESRNGTEIVLNFLNKKIIVDMSTLKSEISKRSFNDAKAKLFDRLYNDDIKKQNLEYQSAYENRMFSFAKKQRITPYIAQLAIDEIRMAARITDYMNSNPEFPPSNLLSSTMNAVMSGDPNAIFNHIYGELKLSMMDSKTFAKFETDAIELIKSLLESMKPSMESMKQKRIKDLERELNDLRSSKL